MNKKTIFILLLSWSVFSQIQKESFEISKFERTSDTSSKYLEKFFFTDSTDIVINFNNKYVIIKKDSTILYKVKSDKIVFKKIMSTQIFNSKINLKNLVNINPNLLNIQNTDKKSIVVNDGIEYKIKIFKRDKLLELTSYAPEVYIENNFPYSDERRIFVQLHKDLNSLFEDGEYDQIKKLKCVYIRYRNSKRIIKNKKITIGKEIFQMNGLQFISIRSNTKMKIKDFDKKNTIIDTDFINRYNNEELKQLFENKKIYMMELINKKYLLTEVKLN